MSQQPGPLLTASLVALATAAVAYAIYFDYHRREAPEYRRELRRKERHLERMKEEEAKAKSQHSRDDTNRILLESLQEPIPREPAAIEEYVLEHLSLGQQIIEMRGDPKTAALHFFKALQVAPRKSSIVSNYDRTLPKQILEHVGNFIAASQELSSGDLASELRGLSLDDLPAVGPD